MYVFLLEIPFTIQLFQPLSLQKLECQIKSMLGNMMQIKVMSTHKY